MRSLIFLLLLNAWTHSAFAAETGQVLFIHNGASELDPFPGDAESARDAYGLLMHALPADTRITYVPWFQPLSLSENINAFVSSLPSLPIRGIVLNAHGTCESITFVKDQPQAGYELGAELIKALRNLPVASELTVYVASCSGASDRSKNNLQMRILLSMHAAITESKLPVRRLNVIAHPTFTDNSSIFSSRFGKHLPMWAIKSYARVHERTYLFVDNKFGRNRAEWVSRKFAFMLSGISIYTLYAGGIFIDGGLGLWATAALITGTGSVITFKWIQDVSGTIVELKTIDDRNRIDGLRIEGSEIVTTLAEGCEQFLGRARLPIR